MGGDVTFYTTDIKTTLAGPGIFTEIPLTAEVRAWCGEHSVPIADANTFGRFDPLELDAGESAEVTWSISFDDPKVAMLFKLTFG